MEQTQPKLIRLLKDNKFLIEGLVKDIIQSTKDLSYLDKIIVEGPYAISEQKALIRDEYDRLRREGKHNGPGMAILPKDGLWDDKTNVRIFKLDANYINNLFKLEEENSFYELKKQAA